VYTSGNHRTSLINIVYLHRTSHICGERCRGTLLAFNWTLIISTSLNPKFHPVDYKEDLHVGFLHNVSMYVFTRAIRLFALDYVGILPRCDCGCCESVHLSTWSSASTEVSPVPPFRERYNDRILLPDECPGGVFGFEPSGDFRERRLWLRSRPSSLPGDFLRSSGFVLAFSISWLSTPLFESVDLAVPYTTILPLVSRTAPTPPDGVRHRVGISFASVSNELMLDHHHRKLRKCNQLSPWRCRAI